MESMRLPLLSYWRCQLPSVARKARVPMVAMLTVLSEECRENVVCWSEGLESCVQIWFAVAPFEAPGRAPLAPPGRAPPGGGVTVMFY
ncbi:hypothetical protein TVWG_00029 [Tetraselmis viridis virus N1]|nr:hypothetical protein TVWG_00029 [Tetraselmis viridis virus N1]